MATFLLIASLLTLLGLAISHLEILVGRASIPNLQDTEPSAGAETPLVSVIVAARNEEKTIRPALESLLRQNYPHYEIIAVNDRSTDATGQILDAVARTESRLHVIHVEELPPDWLGKNHALYLASVRARGDYLLFTDADVEMAPYTLAKAVRYLLENDLDHITLAPEMRAKGRAIDMMIGTFIYYFGQSTKPWRARRPSSRYYVGIGAFNLVKANAYRAAGTHRAIALRPDDDMMLGKLLKSHGCRQRLLFGKGLIRIAWYETVPEMIAGLMKNAAASFQYSPVRVLLTCLLLLGVFVFPFAAVFCVPGPARWIYLAAAGVILATYFYGSGEYRLCRWHAVMIPFTTLVLIYILFKSTFLVYRNRGIIWRDTHYPLSKLKASH
ncbi:MAG: glycosyltransferase [Sedimentisphaerales bacterium]|nr:glycosyltransferase [Sedimentisphaerales bacterium]